MRPGAVEVQPLLGLGDRAADLGDARHDRRERGEMGADLRGEEAGEARLAGPGGPHSRSDERWPARDAASERTALADEVLLADELVEIPRAHPGGERLALGRRLEERLGSGARWVAARMAWPDGSAAGRVTAAGRRRRRGL